MSKSRFVVACALSVGLLFSSAPGSALARSVSARDSLVTLAARVRRADYEDDRAALKTLAAELTPLTQREAVASRALYWQGFALWRRAINGANDSVSTGEMQRDLDGAIAAFAAASARDTAFADAKLAEASCQLFQIFLAPTDSAGTRARISRAVPLLREARAGEPDNPRLAWVLGASRWYQSFGSDSGQAQAMAIYEKALTHARASRPVRDTPDPQWGEPELLMNLAWSNLNRRVPDPEAAARYAQQALALVPRWHYVRDLLLPQIRAAALQSGDWKTAKACQP